MTKLEEFARKCSLCESSFLSLFDPASYSMSPSWCAACWEDNKENGKLKTKLYKKREITTTKGEDDAS